MMTNRKTSLVTLGLLGLFFLSWFVPSSKTNFLSILSDAQAVQEVSPTGFFPKKSLDKRQLVNAQTQFGFKLFSTLMRKEPGQNIFVSPPSIALALSMLYNGASSKTQKEMAATLAIKGINLEAFNQANLTLKNSLQTVKDDRVKLKVANFLWARQGFSFRYQFLKNNREYYQAQITNLNFDSSEAVGIINRWIQDKTQGKITEVIDKINPQDVLFLINTIYFKGIWQVEFDKRLTKPKPFYLSNVHRKIFSFMYREGQYNYFEDSQFQAISLPYGKGRFSLDIFLPKQGVSLDSIVETLTVEQWKKWIGQLRKQEGILQLPRFNLSYEVDLKKALESLGMSTMFSSSEANFSQLTSSKVYVASVKHKTLVEVNEQGTESAADSSIGVRVTSVFPSEDKFNMIVDRPFLCMIRDHQTETILFMGVIAEPI